jgi:formylglycine-generating enzyme required for sulfatase activity
MQTVAAVDGRPFSMTLVPSGWFWMGSNGHYDWERPKHRVFVDAFEIATTTVTRREYARFLEACGREQPRGWADPAFASPDQPVVGVSWFDATAYCEWLSGLTGERYRLPTEAEWEKACKAGGDADYAWGKEPPESFEYFQSAWPAPRPVAEWRPNGYGLFNMGENVHEWCLDWYAPDYYADSPSHNPYGPESGQRRISRGGSWRHAIKASRAAHRSSLPPEYRYTDYGFRIVRSGR